MIIIHSAFKETPLSHVVFFQQVLVFSDFMILYLIFFF